jgi:anti-sigma factor RsiW
VDRGRMNAEEMPCQELVEVVSDYLEDRLSARDRSRFEQHLEECPYCVEYVEQMRRTVAAVGRLGEGELTPGARRDLVRLFRDWRAERDGSPG